MIKPGRGDRKVNILIFGEELYELQKHICLLAESFGLDRRIERYKGARPIGLYRWDMDCLIDAIDVALDDPKEYPSKDSRQYKALNSLYQRLKQEYEISFKGGNNIRHQMTIIKN